MTGRDWVALILAATLSVILLVVSLAVLAGRIHPTGEGLLGAIVGALVVALIRYLGDARRT